MARRHKQYAAETGVSYEYFFAGTRHVIRPEGLGSGAEYEFVVVPGAASPFTLRVFVSDTALATWQALRGRDLSPNEIYAAAKMRLFQAFDDGGPLRADGLDLLVDGENIEALLEPLDL